MFQHHTKQLRTPQSLQPISLPIEEYRRPLVSSSPIDIELLDSPASPVDYSVFVPISVGLLLVYYFANFIVPNMIINCLQSGERGGDQESEGKD
ncbi:hypothetical protein QJS10_CPB11g01378 [Acorus calamus]|uniref:Uncharacterized protein n=1 Tax=Acorus calamus TaxID=4465 RepID=A0AAV9DS18_ACOCL|nr:hypothetical protein QJS10_CPB11g01378 [Acorus calamus]